MALRPHFIWLLSWFVLLTVGIVLLVGCRPVATEPQPTPLPGPSVPTRVVPTEATPDESASGEFEDPFMTFSEPQLTNTGSVSLGVSGELAFDEIISDVVTDDQPALLYEFSGETGQVVNIEMSDLDETLDPFLLVLHPDGRELARNDDGAVTTFDSAISGLRLPVSGTYMIVATRFQQRFGSSTGAFDLVLDEDGTSEALNSGTEALPLEDGEVVQGFIDDDDYQQVYTFWGQRNDRVTVEMRALPNGNLDSTLILTDSLGNQIIRNDDDMRSGRTVDAFIQDAWLPETGYYSVVATRFQGLDGETVGEFEIEFSIDTTDDPDDRTVFYAALDPVNSISVRSDGMIFSDYMVGRRVGADGVVQWRSTILTYWLPDIAADSVLDAELDLVVCRDFGSAFDQFGALEIYLDPLGYVVDVADPTQLSTDAVLLTEIAFCQPVDVTDEIDAAYNGGEAMVQFRLVFDDISGGGNGQQNREVKFGDPRLRLELD